MADSQIPTPNLRSGLFASLLALAMAAACPLAAISADAGDASNGDTAGGKVLKGDVHDAGALVPSATLTPGADLAQPQPVQQYAGSEHDKLHPHLPPPVPAKAPGDGKGKINQPPGTEDGTDPIKLPPPKLWGQATDNERQVTSPPAWGQDVPVRPPTTPQPPGAHPPSPKKPTTITPPNGVMTWQPGHAVNEVKSQVKPQVQGQAAQPMNFTWAELRAILMNKRNLLPDATAPRIVGPQPLAAKQLALPHHIPATWDEWYQNVARAIYQVWQQEQVCPGAAIVRTTVFASQDVDCQIFEFKPAEDLKRDAAAEAFFRDAALKSVNSVDKSAVCQFPADPKHPKKVVFDIQLTRLVNGPAGCEVTHTHQNPTMTSAQK